MIVVGGEALIDLVPDPSTVDGALRPLPGGGPYNVAITVGRLGGGVRFLSRLSTDRFGDALLRRLVESNVDIGMIQRGTELSTLAVTGIGPDGSAGYSFYVAGTADRLVEDPGELPPEVSTLSLGSLSVLLEPGATVYETLLRRHARRGGLTVLDPNIRPELVSDPDAYRARFRSWLPDIDLLKLSVEDARWLGVDETVIDDGPAAVVLTRGADGLTAITGRGERIDVPAPKVAVVDTIGAGDTVHGALLYRLHRVEDLRGLSAEDWRDVLEFAARAAAVTIARAGAEPPYAKEIM
jgi:fructokinase